jgi:ubiquinone/menaquinone biosynthesis C-methylase UbiE
MRNAAEDRVLEFYSKGGWKEEYGITEDARRFEDLRDCARDYVSRCRLRVMRHIPATGDKILDMASGPIQFPEYLEFSRGFAKRYCVDLSSQALESAEKKLGEHGVYMCGSFFDLELAPDMFDCAISLHTIYHIDRDLQEQAVRKLIAVCKPGAPLVIVYSNPDALLRRLGRMLRKLRAGDRISSDSGLYFSPHPLAWWNRFSDQADVHIYPWRSFDSANQKRLIPDNRFGRLIFSLLFAAESSFPRFFVKYFQYPMIVLTKR